MVSVLISLDETFVTKKKQTKKKDLVTLIYQTLELQ